MGPERTAETIVGAKHGQMETPSLVTRLGRYPSSQELQVGTVVAEPFDATAPSGTVGPAPTRVSDKVSQDRGTVAPPIGTGKVPIGAGEPSLELLGVVGGDTGAGDETAKAAVYDHLTTS